MPDSRNGSWAETFGAISVALFRFAFQITFGFIIALIKGVTRMR